MQRELMLKVLVDGKIREMSVDEYLEEYGV